jgi:hypothetical protein
LDALIACSADIGGVAQSLPFYYCDIPVLLLAGSCYMAAMKAVTGFLGVEVGAPRLPNVRTSDNQIKDLRQALKTFGFFDWIKT